MRKLYMRNLKLEKEIRVLQNAQAEVYTQAAAEITPGWMVFLIHGTERIGVDRLMQRTG